MPRCMILCINRFSPGSRPAFEFNGTLPTLTYIYIYIYIYIFGWMGEVSHALTHSQRKGYDAFNIILTYIYIICLYISACLYDIYNVKNWIHVLNIWKQQIGNRGWSQVIVKNAGWLIKNGRLRVPFPYHHTSTYSNISYFDKCKT
jgi:hypothetical protein